MGDQAVDNKLLPEIPVVFSGQTIFFNFKQLLSDLLFLTELITLKETNTNTKNLCLELQKIIKTLLFGCDEILSKNIINTEQKLIILQEINLKKLIKTTFNNHIKIAKIYNTKLFLTITNKIPKIIIGDLSQVNKILTLIVMWLLKLRLTLDNFKVNIYCKVDLFSKFNECIIASFTFRIKNASLKKFINYDEQSIKIKSKLIPNLIYELLKKSGGFIKYIPNQITVYLPLETQL